MKRTVRALVAIVCIAFAPVAVAGELEDGANAFIRALEQEAISSLTDPAKERPARVQAFRQLFDQKFAVQAIGRWVLGRNWRRATEEEQTEFLKLFEDLMVAMYVDRFENYAGEKLDILKTTPVDENRATVHTEIVRPEGVDAKPISVLWRVGRQDDIYKVLDVVVEGASMSITLQKEFASIVRNTGSVAGLIEELRKKTAELNPS
ncbi:MAG: ABC transporter substrate-binding protein [Rhodospirillales bacterium]|nr:ABC transporter substrate-binding protein [Rhodospirillales bacterium]MBO6788341.1 ABC transporter substrate-binding protein [Rhodospirillales bacterium]